MRLIEADLGEVRAVVVAPDGRFVVAAGNKSFGVFHWATGEPVPGTQGLGKSGQIAFAPGAQWTARVTSGRLGLDGITAPVSLPPNPTVRFTGGVSVSPDGKVLVATGVRDSSEQAKLERWALPTLRSITGFDFWSPFSRLAFSPNGEFLAGIWSGGFELRFAVSGGLDYRHRMLKDYRFTAPGFVSFDRDSGTCVFGWDGEFHVLDISTGTSKPGRRIEALFRDAAFTPSADRFATVGDDGRLKLWNPESWEVTHEYDWGCGPLTCLAFTADGSAGVCGTADGRLVQFDVDE